MNHAKTTLFWIVLAVLVIVSGCNATGGSTSRWLGHSESELITALGTPDNVITLPDGRKVLSWDSYQSPTQVLPCRQSYTINHEGTVSDFVTSSCAARPLMPENINTRRGF